MKTISFSFILLMAICLSLMACSSRTSPASGSEEATENSGPSFRPDERARIEAVIDLAQREGGMRDYELMESGNVALEQSHKVMVEALEKGNGYFFREIYNTFSNEDEKTVEYYVSEFTLRIEDMGSRHMNDDYRVVVSKDSALTFPNEVSAFRLEQMKELKVDGKSYEVFQLLGYNHAHGNIPKKPAEFTERNPPAYHKYWCPEFGTLLVKYAEGMEFILAKTESDSHQGVIQGLVAEIGKTF